MKTIDVTALGEILIDFTYAGEDSEGKALYEENPGGAPANCACAVSRLTGKAAFIGMTGEDKFGRDLKAVLDSLNVNTKGLKVCDSQHTTLAFVNLDKNGERSFSFCRNPGADTQLSINELEDNILEDTKILHIGSLSITDEPSKGATLEAVKRVKKAGGLISYDPNWRAALWKGRRDATEEIKSLFKYADIVKVSDEELYLLFGDKITFEEGCELIHEYGAKLVLVTLGKDGVFYSSRTDKVNKKGSVGVKSVKAVDTTGAGDSFNGGLLYSLTRRDDILGFNEEELLHDLNFACGVASLCVTKRGGIPALPDLSSVESFLRD